MVLFDLLITFLIIHFQNQNHVKVLYKLEFITILTFLFSQLFPDCLVFLECPSIGHTNQIVTMYLEDSSKSPEIEIDRTLAHESFILEIKSSNKVRLSSTVNVHIGND